MITPEYLVTKESRVSQVPFTRRGCSPVVLGNTRRRTGRVEERRGRGFLSITPEITSERYHERCGNVKRTIDAKGEGADTSQSSRRVFDIRLALCQLSRRGLAMKNEDCNAGLKQSKYGYPILELCPLVSLSRCEG